MAGPIAGTATIKVDGHMYPLKGNLTVSGSPVERTGMADQKLGLVGYYETPRVPYIECDMSTLPEVSVEVLEKITDAEIQVDLINRRSYVLSRAYCKGPIDINVHDGQLRIRFEGWNCEEH